MQPVKTRLRRFFPSVVYLATSKVAVATLGNLAFAMALLLYHAIVKVPPADCASCAACSCATSWSAAVQATEQPGAAKGSAGTRAGSRHSWGLQCHSPGLGRGRRRTAQVFLGTLRELEIERVNERISQAVMETCLAMTIFRDEFNTAFVAMFTLLTFIKVFHWLVQDRVEFVETTPSVSAWAHIRIVAFMAWLLVRGRQVSVHRLVAAARSCLFVACLLRCCVPLAGGCAAAGMLCAQESTAITAGSACRVRHGTAGTLARGPRQGRCTPDEPSWEDALQRSQTDRPSTAARGPAGVRVQVVDALLLQYTVEKTLERVGSANLLFAFDFIILASSCVSVFVKHAPARLRAPRGQQLQQQPPVAQQPALPCAWLQVTCSGTQQLVGRQLVQADAAGSSLSCARAELRPLRRYALTMYDVWCEGRWERKGICVFYLQLVTDLLHLVVYLLFFIIVFTHYALPLHLARPSLR